MALPSQNISAPGSDPSNQSYINNPNQYKAFDTSGLSQNAIANANEAGANQIAQAKAQAAGMGAGRGSQAGNAVAGVQAGLGQNAQNVFNQNALTSYNQQLAQQQANNQFNINEQELQNQQWANRAGAANQQSQTATNSLDSILGAGTNSIGGAMFAGLTNPAVPPLPPA